VRLIKILGLAAIAALASMAFIGATSASADSFCLEPGHHSNECPAAKIYKGNVTGLTNGKTAILLENGSIKQECHSTVLALGSTIKNEGAHIGVEVLVDTGALTFTGCSGLCANAESTRPAFLLLQALTLDAFITADGAGLSRARLFNCTFGIECEYQFKNASQLTAIGTDTIIATNVPLEKVGGSFLCPNNNMSFDATW
jgi:hypothetical protein